MTLTTKAPGTTPEARTGPPLSPEPPLDGFDGSATPSQQVVRLLVGLALVAGIFLAAGLGALLLFIAILVLVVMLHELAHFATAKWSGMQVTEYFVGFGPRLWSIRRGETEYGVKAIPAGGYVKITGFTVLDEVAEEDEPRTYRQQPHYKRIIVASAGSAMHFLIALVLALIVALAWGTPSPDVAVVTLEHWSGVAHTPAQRAGLRAGDVIVSVDGRALSDPNRVHDVISRSVGTPVELGIERAGRLLHLSVTPADGRGIKAGGTYLARPSARSPQGFIGFEEGPADMSLGSLDAVGNAFSTVGSYTKGEVLGIGHLFSARGLGNFFDQVTSSKAAARASAHSATDDRPVSLVGIASLGVQAQQQGLQSLLELLIEINIVFGMLNMLPILPFDGGHVAVAAYEWVRTKKGRAFYRADITKMFPVVAVLVAFLAVFVLSALYLDITHPIELPH